VDGRNRFLVAIAGIDIGGTKIIVAVADERACIKSRIRFDTGASRGPEPVVEDMKVHLCQALEEANIAKKDLTAIGIGCGGPLNRRLGVVLTAPNLPGWNGLPLVKIFSEEFGCRTVLDNDANAAALGEARFGAGRGVDDFAYFTVSTGIGGGIIANGHLYHGADDNAAEFGHQVILPDGPRCTCGNWGCLESLASGTAIARRSREKLSNGRFSKMLEMVEGDLEKVNAEVVAEAARMGDALALEIWEETGLYLGLGVANVINILNPKRVVIGGGVSKAGDLLFEPVRRVAKARAMRDLARIVDVIPAALGDDVGIMGALSLALEAEE